jgi:hypothetical protein
MKTIFLLAALILLPSCSTSKNSKPDEQSQKPDDSSPGGRSVPLGQIAYVNDGTSFVLIRTGNTIKLQNDTELEARQGLMPTAILNYSPEYKRGFMTADILQGNPTIGDIVYVKSTQAVDSEAQKEFFKQRADATQSFIKNIQKKKARRRLFKKS